MSTYTTTLREVIKDISNFDTLSIEDMIEIARPKIFNFNYATPTLLDEKEFKKLFETMFISKFMLWEIGFDTFEQFKLQLWAKCSMIMPSYAMKIDMMIRMANLKPTDLMRIKNGNIKNDYNDNSSNSGTDESNGKTIHSTLPINMINANVIGDVEYADDGVKNKQDGSFKNTGNKNGIHNTKYDVVEGIQIDGIRLFMQIFDKDFKKIYEQLMNEFNYLFLGVM